MKKLIIATALTLLTAGSAHAAYYKFDFDDGVHQPHSVALKGSLDNYMSKIAGREIDAGDAIWHGSSNTFGGSDAIFTKGTRSTLNFDVAARHANLYEIEAIGFEWGVYDPTLGRDWGIDVYDDSIGAWRNNVYQVWHARRGDTGVVDKLVFKDSWQVTRLRFHDNGTYDVGMDNLHIWDNAPGRPADAVPEPTAAALFGVGLLVAGRAVRRRA